MSASVGFAGVLAVMLGLFAFIVCLEVIGPPPRWRIDALWVRGHSRAVRAMATSLTVAGVMTFVVLIFPGGSYRSRQLMVVLMWIAAGAVCTAVYWDRLPLIYEVVTRYVR